MTSTSTAPAERGPVRTRRGHQPRWPGVFLISIGVVIAALWAASLPGAFDDGVLTYAGTSDVGNIPVFHLLAEGVMATVAILSGVALLRGSRHADAGALVACGMLIYSSVNSSGWLLHNQPAVTLVTAATIVGSVAVVYAILRPPPSCGEH